MVIGSTYLSFHFVTARSRPKSRKIRKFSRVKPNVAVSLPVHPAVYSDGGEATSFTRLPLRDDFHYDPSLRLSTPLYDIIKLCEAPPPAVAFTRSDISGEIDEECKGEEEFSEFNANEDNSAIAGTESEDDCMEGLDGDKGLIEEGVKEKGVPAVMRCFDRAKIYVKAGDGGNGVVAFRREKFVPFGGPSGGNGGNGGVVYVEVDGSMNSLLSFRKNAHFRAGKGGNGMGSNQNGMKGDDVVVRVAPGTVIRESINGGVEGGLMLELLRHGQRELLLPGGRGGRGNASFRSGMRKAPKIAENGEGGTEMWLDLELKLVADVGIIGAPNAGKSTLLSAISAAQPSIANYPFTTLLPNLGVVSMDYDKTMIVADLPGLLEGAHRGFGLGHEFLRHTERCSVLVHVVDGSSEQPDYEFDAVRLELELFSPGLSEKPYIVAFNKMDLSEAHDKWNSFNGYLQNLGVESLCMSAKHKQGTNEVVSIAYAHLQKEMSKIAVEAESTRSANLNQVADAVKKQRNSFMNDFKIIRESDTGKWHVIGAGIERFVQMTNWRYIESLSRFQHALEACGVNKGLKKNGVSDGDTVIVGEMEMVWNDENGKEPTSSGAKKRVSGSVRWPPLR